MPSTLRQVQRWYATGSIPVGTRVNAVTASLRAENPEADEEELEFLATKAAEETSSIAAMTSGQRRATVALDVPADHTAAVPGGLTALTIRAEVPVAAWVAVFIDDLEWYSVDELPHLR